MEKPAAGPCPTQIHTNASKVRGDPTVAGIDGAFPELLEPYSLNSEVVKNRRAQERRRGVVPSMAVRVLSSFLVQLLSSLIAFFLGDVGTAVGVQACLSVYVGMMLKDSHFRQDSAGRTPASGTLVHCSWTFPSPRTVNANCG